MRAAARLAAALAILLVTAVPASGQGETVEYYGLDALGSVRVVFDATGTIVGRMDYGPFGQELFGGTNMPDRRYAGLFRDGEAGLDAAGARSYQSRTGRFSTVDPIYAGLFEPQRWNRYAYSLNAPTLYTDASGLLADSGTGCETTWSNAAWTWESKCPGGSVQPGTGGGGLSFGMSLFISGLGWRGSGAVNAGSTALGSSGRGVDVGTSQAAESISISEISEQSSVAEVVGSTDCQALAAGLAEMGSTTAPWNLPQTGVRLMTIAYVNPFKGIGMPSGFKPELVLPGSQGDDVYRHVVGAVGAVLTGPFSIPIIGGETAYDTYQTTRGHAQGPAEILGDVLGAKVGLQVVRASFTRNTTAARANITSLLCK